jgi:hypothetical protein
MQEPKPKQPFSLAPVSPEKPDVLEFGTLYPVGENGHLHALIMVCPCGCGEIIELNTLADDAPRWQLEQSKAGASVVPSILRTVGCESHFWLLDNHILWC